jgi:ABC-type xylose transport system substrate-binding protein
MQLETYDLEKTRLHKKARELLKKLKSLLKKVRLQKEAKEEEYIKTKVEEMIK